MYDQSEREDHPSSHVSTAWHEAAIGLGSNRGRSLAILAEAWRALLSHPAIVARTISSPYRSQPVDMDTPHWFVNAVGLIRTQLAPIALLGFLHEIESSHGRIRSRTGARNRDRTLDMDLLLYDDCVSITSRLTLPHPRMLERLFVLVPLAEIAPGKIHPLAHKTIGVLLDQHLQDASNQVVEKIGWDAPLSWCRTDA